MASILCIYIVGCGIHVSSCAAVIQVLARCCCTSRLLHTNRKSALFGRLIANVGYQISVCPALLTRSRNGTPLSLFSTVLATVDLSIPSTWCMLVIGLSTWHVDSPLTSMDQPVDKLPQKYNYSNMNHLKEAKSHSFLRYLEFL